MEKLKIGIVGLGRRGRGIYELVLSIPEAEVVALCDNYEPNLQSALDFGKEKGNEPKAFSDYKEFLDPKLLDAVLVITSWETHCEISIEAMKRGIPCGMEVCGAYDIRDCWDLVDTWEETKTPFMFLENCCYGRYELMTLDMVRKGLFGEVVHCDGAYGHDIRDEIVDGKLGKHYRYDNYIHRNCENYPTHEIGPIAKILNINHGNRFMKLNSIASKAVGMHDYIVRNHADHEELMNAKFNQGDIISTMITCSNGETVLIKLDTTLPRFYSRDFTVHGTRGLYSELNNALILDGEYKEEWNHNYWNNAEAALEKYDHPIWKQFIADGVRGGHGGMDGLVYTAFIASVLNGWDMPINVYDAATWMSITDLSEQSIANGGASVAFPDFTRGKWKLPDTPKNPGPYHIN